MSRGRTTQASFGRRGVAGNHQLTIAPRGAEHANTRGVPQDHSPGDAVLASHSKVAGALGKPDEHAAWSYFKACVAAFATAILLSGFIIDSNAPDAFTSRLFANLISGIVMMTMAPIMLIPIRILADIMKLARIPRGASDILIGGLCGSLMMLPDLMDGQTPRALSLAFIAGGLFGGFVFWRARGYPELDQKHHGKAEAAHAMLERGRKGL